MANLVKSLVPDGSTEACDIHRVGPSTQLRLAFTENLGMSCWSLRLNLVSLVFRDEIHLVAETEDFGTSGVLK